MSSTPTKCRLMVAIFGSAMCSVASAQHVNESTPRPGESRANKHQYFSIHNAYCSDTATLVEQLDYWNVWELELDVRWTDPCVGDDGFWVMHHCADLCGEGWLDDKLDEIAGTNRMQNGFFFLNIELGDGYLCLGCFEGPSFPGNYLEQLEDMMELKFGAAAIYSWQDFVADNKEWPSPQELIRRGKRVAIYANNIWSSTSTIFFHRATTMGATREPTAFWNTGDENALIEDQGDRFLTRRYPGLSCATESGSAWLTAFVNGFNFPSTNCISHNGTVNMEFFHPPIPTHVYPFDIAVAELGTAAAPYQEGSGLIDALDRINFYNDYQVTVNRVGGPVSHYHPSKIDVELLVGSYNVNGGNILDSPVILAASGGSVIIENVAASFAPPPCSGDLDGDGTVGPGDLNLLMGMWGSTNAAGDLDGDGLVSVLDLMELLSGWGTCDSDMSS